jgi:transcriptional regulator of arginine metabolism
MATKAQRRERIARLVQDHPIHSQQELSERLSKAGIEVTQATLSRDLQSMGVLKGPGGYVLPQQASGMNPESSGGSGLLPGFAVAGSRSGKGGSRHAPSRPEVEVLLQRTLRRELRSIDAAGNLVVIRTDAGHANALAVEIDRVRLPEILGTIAGDDTLLLVVRRPEIAARLVSKLEHLTSAG